MEAEQLNPAPRVKLGKNTRVMLPRYAYVCTTFDWSEQDWAQYITKYTTKFKKALGVLAQVRGTFQVLVREDGAAEHLAACDEDGYLMFLFSAKPKKHEVMLAVKALGYDPEALKLQADMMKELS